MTAQNSGRRMELEQALQSRYRLTVLGGGILGIHGGENSVRRAGGIVVLRQPGAYGSYDRSRMASNSISNGKVELLSGDPKKDILLAPGEKFYVTSVYVGTDVISLGLLSVRMIPSSSQTAQVWSSLNFFFSKDTLEQGNINRIYPVMDAWITPEDSLARAPAAPVAAPAASEPVTPTSAPPPASTQVELKPGMTRDEIVSVLGPPQREVSFEERQWIFYPAITLVLEKGRLASVDSQASPPNSVRILSDPVGAEIYLDGSFVGSTPTTLQLTPGTYQVAVKLAGYQQWQRELKVLPGAETNVNARLVK